MSELTEEEFDFLAPEGIKKAKEKLQTEKIRINISATNLQNLKEKYPAVDVNGFIEKKVKYYRAKPFKERTKLIWVDKIKEFIEFVNEDYVEPSPQKKEQENKKNPFKVFSKEHQTNEFFNLQPVFYDKAKNFWLWDDNKKKWELTDEVDILNMIKEALPETDIVNSKTRQEIINSIKQYGRKNAPKPIKQHWVQFKDKIYDIKTGETFPASAAYFVKNPIPWKVGNSTETPTIDKLFCEWVGENYVPTLFQIAAYVICPERFMQRIIAFVGGGSNGKGTFVKLLYKFLGGDNCVSSELKLISENQFETAIIFGKLLAVFGEVSYDDLKNTNTLKQIAGEDKLRFCFKGKTPFTDVNTAMGLCLTNSLPTTPDKSLGFYRKWLIIDFPNQFKELKKDLIEDIPEIEFENLARKSLEFLKQLYAYPAFINEGNFEERVTRYEERSNPVMRFIEEFCFEEEGFMIGIRDFTNECNKYMKKNHLRILTSKQVGKILNEEGFVVGNRKIDDISRRVIINLKMLIKMESLV